MPLDGTLLISPIDNSIVNIADAAGSGSYVAIDLSILGTVVGGGVKRSVNLMFMQKVVFGDI